MARNQYSFAKRRREIEKKKKKEAKLERKLGKKNAPEDAAEGAPAGETGDSTTAEGPIGTDNEGQA